MPDNEDIFGRQDGEHLMDWNWRMRERQVSRMAFGYSHEKGGEPDTEMTFQPPHSCKTTGSESGN